MPESANANVRGADARGSRWFPLRRPERQTAIRLFCFPHAGAGALAYRPWTPALGPAVDVCPVELPGRGSRSREELLRRWRPVVEGVVPDLRARLDGPYVLHGHSMGALLAYETARALARLGDVPPPDALIVSGMSAPQHWPVRPPVHHLPTRQLLERADDFLGMPPEALADDDIRAALLPPLRADLELSETYRHGPGPPLDCPVVLLDGTDDPFTRPPAPEPAAWAALTTGPFTRHSFPGGHHFLHERPEAREIVRALLVPVARTAHRTRTMETP